MKNVYFLLFFLLGGLILAGPASAQQSILDPDDPIVNYDPNNPPPFPTVPNSMTKWVRTPTVGWNTSAYKAYFYTTGTSSVAFRLLFPKNYGTDPNKKYPMLIFFHGAGEISRNKIYDNELQLVNCGQKIMNEVQNGDYDGFVLFPQTRSSNWVPFFPAVTGIIQYMAENNRLDMSRITVSGLSMGGTATWDFVARYPRLVAGAAPISAAQSTFKSQAVVDSLQSIPLWLSQGGLDTSPLPQTSEDLVNYLRSNGVDIRYTLYPNKGHGVWNAHYDEPDAFSWMVNVNKANPHIFSGRTEFCLGQPFQDTLSLTAGFEAYQWSRNGIVIPGAISHRLVINDTGTYAARYKSGGQWTYWSPNPVKISYKAFTQTPSIKVSGLMSRVVPAPDGNNSVRLALPPGFDSYRWENESGELVGTDSTYNAKQAGSYQATVIEISGCPAKPSPPFYVGSNSGPNPPDPATGLSARAESQTSIYLDWSNSLNPAYNETAFEIYRGTSSGGPYRIAGIVPADTLSFIDNNLVSNTNYYYVVRAISRNSAAPVSSEITAATLVDNQAPTAPTGLNVSETTANTITLQWNRSKDNVGIENYAIYINGVRSYISSNNVYTVRNLTHGERYVFTVKAFDPSGNKSPASNQVVGSAVYNGLSYKAYTYTGSWATLPDFSVLSAVDSGIVENISPSPAPQSTYYGLSFDGYIHIVNPGTYTFYTNSDDGSSLLIDRMQVVNNDGLHGTQERSGTCTFDHTGWYPFRIEFYQETGSAVLSVSWQKSGSHSFAKSSIPDSVFTEIPIIGGTVPLFPTGITVTALSYDSVRIAWQDRSFDEQGFEVYRATESEGPYQIIHTTKADSISFMDTLVMPSTTYFYKVQAINEYGSSGYDPLIDNNWTTTLGLPPAPDPPTELEATIISADKIHVTWHDESLDNIKFELFRSIGNNSNYKKITNLAAGSSSYTDSVLFGNTVYYYKLQAIGVGGRSDFSSEVSATTPNHMPSIVAKSDHYVRYGERSDIAFNAVDKDNETLILTAEGVPSFGLFEDNGDGSGTFTFSPSEDQQGEYPNIKIVVVDQHGGRDSALFRLIVGDFSRPVIQSTSPITANTFSLTRDTVLVVGGAGRNLSWQTPGIPQFIGTGITPEENLVLRIAPSAIDTGVYSFQVVVTNEVGLSDTENVTVTVNTVSLQKWYMNFAANDSWRSYPGSPWNNIRGDITTGLTDSNGQSSNIGITFETNWWDVETKGAQTGDNTGIYADNVLRDNFYFGRLGGPDAISGEITGLDPTKSYALTFFASSTWRFISDNGHTVYQVGARKDSIDVEGNTERTAIFSGLTPSSDGKIRFTMSKGRDAGAGYLNALVVSTLASTPPVSPEDLVLSNAIVKGANAVKVSWQLGSANASTIEVYRSMQHDGGYTLLNEGMENGSVNSYTDTTVAPASSHTYYYYLVASNVYGHSVSTDTVSITTSEYIDTREWYMNFAANDSWRSYPGSPWNNIRSDITTGLTDNNGQSSNIGITFETNWWDVETKGAQTGDNTGIYADNVLRDNFYFGRLGGPDAITGEITGLDPTKSYALTFFASSTWRFISDNGHTVYQVGARKDSIDVEGNTERTAIFSGLTPSSDGKIRFTMSKGRDAGAGYLNALVVRTISDIPPAMPVNFRLVNTTVESGNAIEVSWQPGSNNTDTISVYRAVSSGGPYSRINLGQSGLDSTSLLDTNVSSELAKTYYYYLVATNTYGNSATTDTMHITTINLLPAVPFNLTLSRKVIDYQYAVALNWQLAQDNAEQLDIYRSTERSGGYIQIASLQGDTSATSYVDTTVSFGATYYYYMTSKNEIGISGPVDTVSIDLPVMQPTPPPIISEISESYVAAGTVDSLHIDVTAPGGMVTFVLDNAPSFASLEDIDENTAKIVFRPSKDNIGDYDSLRLIATDPVGNDDTAYFDVHITDGNLLAQINLNFTPAGYIYDNGWNNIEFSTGNNSVYTDLINGNGRSTNISLTTIDAWSGTQRNGANTFNNAGVVPDSVMEVGYYINDDRPRTIKVSGLDSSRKYNLVFFASSISGGNTNYTTFYTINGNTASLDGIRNTSRVARINGLHPDTDGCLTIIVTRGPGASRALLNAIMIEAMENNTLNAPDGLTAVSGEDNIVLRWTDRSDNEQQFKVLRSRALNGSYTDVATVNANVTSFIDNNVLPDTRYFYKIAAIRDNGETMTSDVASATTPKLEIYLNFNLSEDPAPAPWNNTQIPPVSGDSYGPFFDSKGNNSGITLDMISNFSGENAVGLNTGSNSGLFPDLVTQSAYYLNSGSDTVVMKISNLNISMKYDITLFGSIFGWGWENTTQFISGNQMAVLETSYNTENTVTLSGLSPDMNGQIVVKIINTPSSSFAVLNALIIKTYENYDNEGNKVIDSSLYMRLNKDNNKAIDIKEGDDKYATNSLIELLSAVYPNPFYDVVHLKLRGLMAGKLDLIMYDVNGKMVSQETRPLSNGINLFLYRPRADLQPGVYILSIKLVGTNQIINVKLLKL